MLQLNENNFNEEVINSQGVVLIDWWASWCGPCRMYAHTFEKVAKSNDGVKFAKLDVDDNHALAMEYKVSAIPATMMFKDGKLIKTWSGVVQSEVLQKAIDSAK